MIFGKGSVALESLGNAALTSCGKPNTFLALVSPPPVFEDFRTLIDFVRKVSGEQVRVRLTSKADGMHFSIQARMSGTS